MFKVSRLTDDSSICRGTPKNRVLFSSDPTDDARYVHQATGQLPYEHMERIAVADETIADTSLCILSYSCWASEGGDSIKW